MNLNAQQALAEIQQANTEGRQANLQFADLREANLEGANLEGANLEGANLEGADLQFADLREANLLGAKLQYANLLGAKLQYAKLQYADLRGANLEGANLLGAKLASVCLHRTKGLIYASANVDDHDGGYLMNGWIVDGETRIGCGCFYGTVEECKKHVEDKASKDICLMVLDFIIKQLERRLHEQQ